MLARDTLQTSRPNTKHFKKNRQHCLFAYGYTSKIGISAALFYFNAAEIPILLGTVFCTFVTK